MKVDHAVVAGLFTNERGGEVLAASQRQITGHLVDSAGNIIKQVSAPGKPDKVSHSCMVEAPRIQFVNYYGSRVEDK